MIDVRVKGQDLLRDWFIYRSAKPKDHVLDIQREKDELQRWASMLQATLLWESDENLIAEACYQFESRLDSFKDKLVIELLTGGPA